MNQEKEVCCAEFNPGKYQNKSHKWKDKLFLKDEVLQIFHIPLNMGSVVKRMFKKIEDAKASPPPEEFLMLCYDPSPWKSEIYMTISKNIPNEKVAKLTGKFISRVYEGPYNAVPKWIKNMDKYLLERGEASKRYYIHYAYCPKCAKKYGHNYALLFAKLGV